MADGCDEIARDEDSQRRTGISARIATECRVVLRENGNTHPSEDGATMFDTFRPFATDLAGRFGFVAARISFRRSETAAAASRARSRELDVSRWRLHRDNSRGCHPSDLGHVDSWLS